MRTILLEDCCEILDSMRVPITAADREKGPYPYYGANGIQDHIADYIFDDDLVLLAEDGGNFGSKTRPIAYRVSGKCWVNNHAHVLKPKKGLDVDFLCYSLMFYNTDGLVNGATRQKLTQSTMRKMLIPNVPFEEQRKIVEQLNKAVAVKELRQQELQKLDDLIKAQFVEMFGDYDLSHQQQNWVPISEIGTVVGGSTPKTSVSEYWNGEYRWISPAELKADSGVIYDSVKKITKSGIESCSLQELPVGTVILSSRAPIGKVAIAGNTFYCNQGFKNIICTNRIIPRFLYSLLLFNTDYLNSLGRGATFKEISKSIVENIRVPVPEIAEQQAFENFVKQIDKSKFAIQKALDKAQLLFDSLMQQYFG